MNVQTRPSGQQPWEEVRTRLDQNAPFSNMHATPYYRDAVYDLFSKQEYQRRYRALRAKMREHKLDCVIGPAGANAPTRCRMCATAAAANTPRSWLSGSRS
jgi:hypothetical protein